MLRLTLALSLAGASSMPACNATEAETEPSEAPDWRDDVQTELDRIHAESLAAAAEVVEIRSRAR